MSTRDTFSSGRGVSLRLVLFLFTFNGHIDMRDVRAPLPMVVNSSGLLVAACTHRYGGPSSSPPDPTTPTTAITTTTTIASSHTSHRGAAGVEIHTLLV
ncbi:hypothetical protein E2C01_001702 [Portunus trituberculatus]|uniref:Uncharacterized protein n=1 Tax=Portunus trituberculatus TaxID=210409 RepID=A0A5B7CHZ7_PORTR|nr:hypothetical protein [Portunus trituberculatus]